MSMHLKCSCRHLNSQHLQNHFHLRAAHLSYESRFIDKLYDHSVCASFHSYFQALTTLLRFCRVQLEGLSLSYSIQTLEKRSAFLFATVRS